MRTERDLKVNFCDDIVLDGNDIVVEIDASVSAIRNAQRRVSARSTDFQIRSEIAAGIESFMQNRIDTFLLSDLENTISLCLTQYGLFNKDEFKVLFDTTNEDKLGVIISFDPIIDQLGSDATFSVYIDKQNQRSYV
jgi:hypothetical protein